MNGPLRSIGALAILIVLIATTAPRALCQGDVLVNIRDLSPHELRSAGFALNAESEVRIDAVGAEHSWRRRGWDRWNDWALDRSWVGNAWILDAATRQVVWELREADTDSGRGDLETVDEVVHLPAGEYIVHYASYSGEPESDDWGWGDDLRTEFDYDDDGQSEEFGITVRGRGRSLSRSELTQARDSYNHDVFISFIGLGPAERKQVGFKIEEAMEIEIYAIGEVIDDGTYDYAWLIDTETGEAAWKLEERGSRNAGGARKNRVVHRTLRLEPGSYAAIAVSDNSHDVTDWNAPPPYDPEFWGLTMRTTDPADRVQLYPYERAARRNAFVSLTGIGDGEAVSKGFSLARRSDVRVYAVGEGSGGRMYDAGSIVGASTRRPVWEMDFYATEHAGGAAKNRMVDQVISLEPGNYMAYYVTDDSHSPYEWNDAPPLDREAWGITLAIAGDEGGAVEPYDPAADPSIIAQLIGIRDHERRRQRFTLDRETAVRIYALGEGSGGEMYDYAWIEDASSGRSVWEMKYRSTQTAGGARKNRLFDEIINLPAGDYMLHYDSDDSHSFGDWNAAPPADPFHYGVTLLRN